MTQVSNNLWYSERSVSVNAGISVGFGNKVYLVFGSKGDSQIMDKKISEERYISLTE
jgi:hypothetical protein